MNTSGFQAGDLDALTHFLKAQQISECDTTSLEEAIKGDGAVSEKGSVGKRVKNWMKEMLGKSLDGVWGVSISAAGKLLSEADWYLLRDKVITRKATQSVAFLRALPLSPEIYVLGLAFSIPTQMAPLQFSYR